MAEAVFLHPVFTVGHSNHSLERFGRLLREHGISAVADVRSVPFSRSQPQFNREEVSRFLKGTRIRYVFLGRELGARSEDESCYDGGRVLYRRLAATELFQSGLKRVLEGSERHRIALMCAEREPLACHRTLLVARELEAAGAPVVHIHADGRIEAHASAMLRLVEDLRLSTGDLFDSGKDAIAKAYEEQERRIAYVRKQPVSGKVEVLS
jgi:uncharacterized protein (DUF488 family)